MAAVVPARTDRWGCKLAASALVLVTLSSPRAADAQSPKLEAAYVVLGPQGPVARAVLAQASALPHHHHRRRAAADDHSRAPRRHVPGPGVRTSDSRGRHLG